MSHLPSPESWNFDPVALIALAAVLALYLLATGPWRARIPGSQAPVARQTALFLTGWTILALSVVSPLDTLGRYYWFSAHTAQLFILITVSTPMMMAGLPDWLARLLLPVERLRAGGGGLRFSVIAVLLFNGLILIWHTGPLYDLANANTLWHDAQLLTFVVAGAFTWWPLLTPAAGHIRLNSPLQILYLAAESIPLDIFGVAVIFAPLVIYHSYAVAPRVLGLPALMDQEIAGGILAVPGNILDIVLMSVVFFSWIERMERAQRERERLADAQPAEPSSVPE